MEFRPKKKLGFGMMRMPQLDPADAGNVDIDQVCRMVDLCLERGFTYFDTALMYNGGNSEAVVKKVLVERHPRESFTLATKLHGGYLHCAEDRDRVFNGQLEKTGAGYFDYYLIHGIESGLLPVYERYDCFGWLLEKKAQGLVKHAGFSFHDKPEVLDRILTEHPEMEFVQLQINYLDWESAWIQSRANYEVCMRHNKPVIVMEPVKGGTLAKLPEQGEALLRALDPAISMPSWAIRFAASLPNVMLVLSGMSTLAQVEDNTGYMSAFEPLSDADRAACFRVAEIINSAIAVPCTGCHYCTDGCPMRIAIPEYFSLYNEDMREDMEHKGWTINFTNYERLNARFGRASECVACGQCEAMCPQHLPIIEKLKAVASFYEGN